jgi:RNA polymerase-binding transcription factor DksA
MGHEGKRPIRIARRAARLTARGCIDSMAAMPYAIVLHR